MITRIVTTAGMLVLATVAAGVVSADSRSSTDRRHVVLVGASIGKSWNLPDLPTRLGDDRYTFEALQVWEYDKTPAVDETLLRPARKFKWSLTYVKGLFGPPPKAPDLMILKECSSYFGGSDAKLEEKKALFQAWVQQVRTKNIPVMITTVAPITRARAAQDGVQKQHAIREFNNWIRNYAAQQGIVVVDLEKALRADDVDRFLRDDLTSGDGSHLNRRAYEILDRVMAQALCEQDGRACGPINARL